MLFLQLLRRLQLGLLQTAQRFVQIVQLRLRVCECCVGVAGFVSASVALCDSTVS